jgi:hypothetical protein
MDRNVQLVALHCRNAALLRSAAKNLVASVSSFSIAKCL